VQLKTISPYLAHLSDEATADLLVAPQDIKNSRLYNNNTWWHTVRKIGDFKSYYGLDGMKIDDVKTPYDKGVAMRIECCYQQAKLYKQPFKIGWFIPTLEILCGRSIASGDIIVENNLYFNRGEVANQGKALITDFKFNASHWYVSCTPHPKRKDFVYGVNFSENVLKGSLIKPDTIRKVQPCLMGSKRLVALSIDPPF